MTYALEWCHVLGGMLTGRRVSGEVDRKDDGEEATEDKYSESALCVRKQIWAGSILHKNGKEDPGGPGLHVLAIIDLCCE